MITQLHSSELPKLKEWSTFPFPNLDSGLYCSQRAIYNDQGKLIGGAFLKLTSEAMLILDPNAKGFERAKGIKEIFTLVPIEMDKFGLDQVHVFVLSHDSLAQVLREHYNFQNATGIPLVLTR